MKSLKSIVPLLLASNPDVVSSFSFSPQESNLPESNKKDESPNFVDKNLAKGEGDTFSENIDEGSKIADIKEENDKGESKGGFVSKEKMVCKDGVCYISFDDEDDKAVKKEDSPLFVEDKKTSFVDKYNKAKDVDKGMER